MEATINDVYVNTHIDTEVTAWSDGKPKSDAQHIFKVLYRTREGIWYLLNCRAANKEDITLLTVERVKELLAQRRLDHVLVRYFDYERVKKVAPPSAAALEFGHTGSA